MKKRFFINQITRSFLGTALCGMSLASMQTDAMATTVRLEDLDLTQVVQSFRPPKKNLSSADNPITLAGKTYEHGLGVCPVSLLQFAVI